MEPPPLAVGVLGSVGALPAGYAAEWLPLTLAAYATASFATFVLSFAAYDVLHVALLYSRDGYDYSRTPPSRLAASDQSACVHVGGRGLGYNQLSGTIPPELDRRSGV